MFASTTTTAKLANAFVAGGDLSAKFRKSCAVSARPDAAKRSALTVESAWARATWRRAMGAGRVRRGGWRVDDFGRRGVGWMEENLRARFARSGGGRARARDGGREEMEVDRD